MEHRHVVATRDGLLDRVSADEMGAADEQQAHVRTLPRDPGTTPRVAAARSVREVPTILPTWSSHA
jgi:hypothetical protein